MRLTKQSPGDSLPRVAIASTQTAATLLALGSPGLTVVMPGKEAIALAPLSVSVLDRSKSLSEPCAPASAKPASPGTKRRKPQALWIDGWLASSADDASSEPREDGELPRIDCSKS